MENNENLVTNVTENVENTTEETQREEKKYTQAEVDAIVGKAKARAKARVEKDYNRKYGSLVNTLQVGTGIGEDKSVEELDNSLQKYYETKGVKIKKTPKYSTKDIETLAKAEASEVIDAGYEEVCEEVDRLSEIGAENMTEREKAVFNELCKHRQNAERKNELSKIGVSEEIYNSPEFREFAGMFRSDIPITQVYDQFTKTQPKKEIRTMGSMKNTTSDDKGIKDYYTYEEAVRFTKQDFDKNPALLRAVENSMSKWR